MKSNQRTAFVNNCVKLEVSGSFESPKFNCLDMNFSDYLKQQITNPSLPSPLSTLPLEQYTK